MNFRMSLFTKLTAVTRKSISSDIRDRISFRGCMHSTCIALIISVVFSTSLFAAELSRQNVADILTPYALNNKFPTKLSAGDVHGEVQFDYTFDQDLHRKMADVYLRYQPDYACFVAMDAKTGEIINLTSFLKEREPIDNLVLRANYPAASVFKFVTAAAALDSNKLSPSSVIPYNGKSTSLYKSQVFAYKDNKWTRRPTLIQAFAKSVNPVFGRVGARVLGQEMLSDYASRFGFGEVMVSDINLPPSKISLTLQDEWEVVEAASGYTRGIRMSPVHAAQMMSSLFNEGRMVRPYFVNDVTQANGDVLYSSTPAVFGPSVFEPSTAAELKQLLRATVKSGSARGSFSNLSRYRVYRDLEIGGKTGSLTGDSPKGRHDWFVGYASKGGRDIVFASLIVNKEKWTVRSAYVARQFIYHFYTQQQELQDEAMQLSAK
jgi:peptidoglycan glycosyltransferase